MDYDLMTQKLIAARKEIRANVFSLWVMDEIERIHNEAFERMIWAGDPFYYEADL